MKKKKAYVLGIIIAGLFSGISVAVFIAMVHDLPQIRSLESYRPSAVTRVYSKDHVLLHEFYLERRDPVDFNQIPEYLKSALIATEDRNFYIHCGIDIKGIARAIIKDILAGQFVEGASTITQQLSRTLFLTPDKTITRKLREALLSIQLERRYTKDDILNLYLNQVYFGSGAYGVEAAAQVFFGKSVQDLTLGECALIAGMPKAPSRYSPLIDRKLAEQRKNTVLIQMKDTGIISAEDYTAAIREPLQLATDRKSFRKAPYYIEYIRNQLEDEIGSEQLYRGGLTIQTSLSYELQKVAEDAVIEGLDSLEERMKKSKLHDLVPQAALVSLDVKTGAILAMVGGRDFSESPFNRCSSAKRQPGSSFKPFVYACAIENGMSQNMMLRDVPVEYPGVKRGNVWRPKNFSGKYYGMMTLRKALAVSENIPAVMLMKELGPETVIDFARKFGIDSSLSPNLSLALGTSEISLLEITSAYAVFPNKGQATSVWGVSSVYDIKKREIFRNRPAGNVAMSREGAAVMVNLLEAVINEGTGRRARTLGKPVGGKTGTTDDYKDALFIGFSQSIVTGVWVGCDDNRSLGRRETGAKAALPIWVSFMRKALEREPYEYFDIPDGLVKVRMHPLNGKRLPADSSTGIEALFRKGKEPV